MLSSDCLCGLSLLSFCFLLIAFTLSRSSSSLTLINFGLFMPFSSSTDTTQLCNDTIMSRFLASLAILA